MVLPASAADLGAVEAQGWLAPLIRALEHARRGILIALTEATPTQLGPVVRALSKGLPWVEADDGILEVCLRAQDLLALAKGSRVLLRVRVEDLEWLNLYRPIFADRELRAILWLDEPALDGLVRGAVDLFDWVSRVVPVPAKPLPDFAVEGVRAALEIGEPFAWTGGGLHEVLAAVEREDVNELDARAPFLELVAALAKSGLPVVSGLRDQRDAWRVRMALARAGRAGSWVALAPAATIEGMWQLHARQSDWDQAADQLREAGLARPELLAAWVNLEPERIEWVATHVGENPEAWELAKVARGTAPAWTMRRHVAEPSVEDVRALLRSDQGPPPEDVPGQVLWSLGEGSWDEQEAGAAAPRIVRALRSLGEDVPSVELLRAVDAAGFDDVGAGLALVRWDRGADRRADRLVLWLMTHGHTVRALEVATAWHERATEGQDEDSVAAVKQQLGELHRALGNGELAVAHLVDSVAIRRVRAQAQPDRLDLQAHLAAALCELGHVQVDRGNIQVARSCFAQAIDIYRVVVEREPEGVDLQMGLAGALDKIGQTHEAVGDHAQAVDCYEEALALARMVAAREPERAQFQGNLSSALERLGELHLSRDAAEVASTYLEESLAIRRSLMEREPDNIEHWRLTLRSLGSNGRARVALGELELARGLLEESCALARMLVEREPERSDMQRDLSLSLRDLGDVHRALGDREQARQCFEASLTLARALAEREPTSVMAAWDICVCLDRLGRTSSVEEARRYFDEALALERALVEREPSRVDIQRDLAVGLQELGRVERELGNNERALQLYEEARALYHRLIAHAPERVGLEQELVFVLLQLWTLSEDPDLLSEAKQRLAELRARGALDAEFQRLAAMLDAE